MTQADQAEQAPGVLDRVARSVRREKAAYTADTDEDRPLGSYTVLMGAYGGLVAALAGAVRLSGRPLPERVGAADLALISVATHKLSHPIAKDPVTSPLRAAFTRYAGTAGEAELAEEARGTGPQHAVGEQALGSDG